MAKTYEDEKRNKLINLVAEHIIETGDSYRETSKYLENEEDIKISHVTIKDYCDKYINAHGEKGQLLKEVISGNKPKGIENKEIRERVLLVSRIYTSSDFTIEEIADNLECTPWTIYRDLTVRLPQINNEESQKLSILVTKKLKDNSFNNLRNQNVRNS